MKKLILIMIVGMVFFSCKKKQTIHITAKNAATGEPYSGLTYYVVTHKNVLKPYGGKKAKTVATGTLDENGEAIVTKRLSKNNGHGVRVEEPENSCYNKNIQLYFSEEDGKNFKAEFEFAECAYLKLKIENVNCLGLNDKLILYQGNKVGSFNYNQPWEHNGCAYWETSGYSNIPMGEQYYKWEVTRNNVTNIYYDTIYLNPGEYKTYEINY